MTKSEGFAEERKGWALEEGRDRKESQKHHGQEGGARVQRESHTCA